MNIRIYQSYYLPEQRRHLDPAFEPFDNTANFLPELREYPLIQQMYHRQCWDQVDLAGMFSWKWREKTRGMTGDQVIEWIQAHPGADAYFFNPFGNDLPYIYNIWELAEWCHPGMMEILTWLWPRLGWDPADLYQPHEKDHMTWCNFIVATRGFWQAWLDLVQRYLQEIAHMPQEIQKLHARAGYQDLTFFPFIQERMATALAHARPDFRILTCQVSSTGSGPSGLAQLREQACLARTAQAWHAWRQARDPLLGQHRRALPCTQDLALKWIDLCPF